MKNELVKHTFEILTGFRCSNSNCYHHMQLDEIKVKFVASNAVIFNCPECGQTIFVGLIDRDE